MILGKRLVIFVFLLLVLSNSTAIAQSTLKLSNGTTIQLPPACPTGKVCVAFEWVNGILMPNQSTWVNEVIGLNGYLSKFTSYLTLRGIDPTNIVFVPVYNVSGGAYNDLSQSDREIKLAQLHDQYNQYYAAPNSFVPSGIARSFAENYIESIRASPISSLDADVKAVTDTLQALWALRYYVVQVGHSQGSLITNLAFMSMNASNPGGMWNTNYHSEVIIATPAHFVADRRNKYTTQCNDVIQFVRLAKYVLLSGYPLNGSLDPLPWNMTDNSGATCLSPEAVAAGYLFQGMTNIFGYADSS